MFFFNTREEGMEINFDHLEVKYSRDEASTDEPQLVFPEIVATLFSHL